MKKRFNKIGNPNSSIERPGKPDTDFKNQNPDAEKAQNTRYGMINAAKKKFNEWLASGEVETPQNLLSVFRGLSKDEKIGLLGKLERPKSEIFLKWKTRMEKLNRQLEIGKPPSGEHYVIFKLALSRQNLQYTINETEETLAKFKKFEIIQTMATGGEGARRRAKLAEQVLSEARKKS